MKNKFDRLIEAYFEGTTSPRQEQRLKAFLASEEGAAKEYDDVRAVMGFFSVGRSLEVAAKGLVADPEGQDATEGPTARKTAEGLAAAEGLVANPERQDATEGQDATERRRTMPGRTVTLIPGWAKAVAVACSVAIVIGAFAIAGGADGLLDSSQEDGFCVSCLGGQTITDESQVMEDVENTLADLLSNHETVDEKINEFFGK